MNMFERFERQEPEDIILIGEAVETFLNTELGRLFKERMIPNLQKMEISSSRVGNASAERSLGRIEAYDTVLNDLLTFVEKKRELQAPIERDTQDFVEAEQHLTQPVLRGGAI